MEGIDLPDINVWLALADPDHEHHQRAKIYWDTESSPKFAFTRVTMLGLIRLLCNPHVMKGNPLDLCEAWRAYDAFRSLPDVVFLNEKNAPESQMRKWTNVSNFPPSRLTDAWIAAMALTTRSRLVSFDSDYRNFAGLSFCHLVIG